MWRTSSDEAPLLPTGFLPQGQALGQFRNSWQGDGFHAPPPPPPFKSAWALAVQGWIPVVLPVVSYLESV